MSSKDSFRRELVTVEEVAETIEQAAAREAQADMRANADRRAQAIAGDKLQLKLKVSAVHNVIYIFCTLLFFTIILDIS